ELEEVHGRAPHLESGGVRVERLAEALLVLGREASDETDVRRDAGGPALPEDLERVLELDLLADLSEDALRAALEAEVDRGAARRGHQVEEVAVDRVRSRAARPAHGRTGVDQRLADAPDPRL